MVDLFCLFLRAAWRAPRRRDVPQRVDIVLAMGNPKCLAFLGPSCATIHQLARAAWFQGVLETRKEKTVALVPEIIREDYCFHGGLLSLTGPLGR